MMEIKFNSELNFSEDEKGALRVGGLSVRSGYIESKHFILPRTELKNIASTLEGSYLLTDHSRSVKDVIGQVVLTNIIENAVSYEATLSDEGIADKIKSGVLKHSSVGLEVGNLLCSICGSEYGTCYHLLGQEYESIIPEAKEYLSGNICAIYGSNIRAREQSIVLFPAIEGATIKPLNFDDGTEKMIKTKEFEKGEDLRIASLILRRLEEQNNDSFNELQEQVNSLTESINLLIVRNNILETELLNEKNKTLGEVAEECTANYVKHNDLKESIRETIFRTRRDNKKVRMGYNFRRELYKFDLDEAVRELNLARK